MNAYLMGAVFAIFFLPMLAMIGGFILILFFAIGCCIAVSGITGIIMNVMYRKKTGDTDYKPTGKVWNIISLVYGFLFSIFPIALIVAGVIAGN